MIKEEKTISSVLYTIEYTYNKDNVLTSITYPSGRPVAYTLDQTGKVTQVSTTLNGSPKVLVSNLSYLPYGGITGLNYGNGLSLSHGYDNQYRTSSIAVGSVLDRIYNYDANGNVTWIDDAESPGNEASENAGLYTYQQATNKLTQVQGELNVVYGYDANGNITSANNRTFTYDLSSRLIRVEDNSVTIAEYVYNAVNQRVKKILPAPATRIFHYDAAGHLIAETSSSGQTLVEYFYLGDQPLAMIRPTELLYYYHNDHLGTPQILTNDTGAVSWKAVYGPFGEAEISVQTVENPLRFPGQYYDQETGLHYNWNRYYDPKTGRYLVPDPIGLEGGVNLFVFVQNNPITNVDLLGLIVIPPDDPRNPRHWRDLYDYCNTWRSWGQQRYRGVENSSMRHCVVSCVVASKYGNWDARLAGTFNEIYGLFRYDLPDICGRLTGRRPWAFQPEDFVDNERGIQCAKKNKCIENQEAVLENCIKCCQGN